MKLKRIAAMLTAAVMAVSLAACGGNTGTNTESSQNPKENAGGSGRTSELGGELGL